MKDFEGLVAIVTGGASGLGFAIAKKLQAEGAKVAIFDRDISKVPETFLAIAADITDDNSVKSAVSNVIAKFGGIDIVSNNAGIGAAGDVATNPDEEWHRVYDVNVVGIARVTRAALPHLKKSKHGAIVNTASVVANIGLPNRALYSATKGAVVALTRAMAADFLHDGIRVNCVNPGTADTPWVERLVSAADDAKAARAALEARQPHSRLVSPEEIADAVAYLANPKSGSTNGHELIVDGGLTAVQVPKK